MGPQSLTALSGQLSTKQSLAIVRIFLNCSIACICHTRELLRWTSDCFRTRYIDQIVLGEDSTDLYNDFCHNEFDQHGSSQELRILVRSREKRANRILDMLEFGVFDALERAYLDSVQILIMDNPHQSASVLESYRFAVSYHKDNIAGIHLSSSNENICSFSSTQKSLKAAIRTLLRSLQDRSRLPRKRYSLRMVLSFTQNCPNTYQPQGFADANDEMTTMFHKEQDLSQAIFEKIAFRSSFHTIHIDANVQFCEGKAGGSQLQDTHMSKELRNMQHTSQNISGLFAMVSTAQLPILARTELSHKAVASDLSTGHNNQSATVEFAPRTSSPVDLAPGPPQHPAAQAQAQAQAAKKQVYLIDKSGSTSSTDSVRSSTTSKRRASYLSVSKETPRRRRRISISHRFINVGESSTSSISSERHTEEHFIA